MKKFTFLTTMMLCGLLFNINAQNYMKLDASFYSEVMDEVKNIDIYLPADYYVNPDQQYATIYYLHGGGGNQNEGTADAQCIIITFMPRIQPSAPLRLFLYAPMVRANLM